MNYSDPGSRIVARIEGGPEAPGSLDKALDLLAEQQGGNKFEALYDAFGIKEDGIDPLADWNGENVVEFLRCTLGAADRFVDEYDGMSELERSSRFSDPVVSKLVEMWADSGRDQSVL
ncbi:hypothetical protein H7171_01105 [Candidatus Saccharibacteria bacterium]|nr:hypothetical protein [Candidatus Saccharibacteria bacterium]